MAGTLDDFFESYYRLRPVNATFTGVHDHDGRLPDWSPEGLEDAAAEMRALRSRLAADGAADLDVTAGPFAVDAALADAFLEIQIAEHDGAHFQRSNPSLATGEAAFALVSLMTRDFAPVEERLGSAGERLRALPTFLDGARRSLVTRPVPAGWTRRALRECEGLDVLLGSSVERWVAASCRDDRLAASVRGAAAEARAATTAFATWLRRESRPATEDRYACGPELLDLLLRRGHWCDRSAEDLLHEARERFGAASARLDEEAGAAAAGGWPEVQARLAALHPTVDDYLPSFERVWRDCREAADAHDLVTWPDAPIRFVPIPEVTRDAAPYLYYLFYRSPAPFDPLPVHDHVVPPIDRSMPAAAVEGLLRATNASVIKLNHVVHHGALGHHVQNHHAYRSPSRVGQVAAVDCASRIGMFAGGTMAEGWACYATDLMEEVGFLTPLERVGEQHTRVRMLARAVVDLSLHGGVMRFDDAVAFYVERVGMAPEAARGEAVKNSMFPGTAVMYWLGTQGIHDLRARRAAVEGPAFSLRAFHDELLGHGSIPVPMVAAIMGGVQAA